MVWLEGILHHSDESPTFLQVPCHVRSRLGSARATDRRGSAGVRGTEPAPGVELDRGDGDRGTPRRVQRPSGESEPGSDRGGCREGGMIIG